VTKTTVIELLEMSGYLGSLDPTQQQLLNDMKDQLQIWIQENNMESSEQVWKKTMEENGENMDALLLRYLRARNFNLELSLKLFTDSLVWRRDFQKTGVESILEESIQHELATGKCFYHGFDKQQRPIVYVKVRLHIKRESDAEELKRYCVYIFEKVRKRLKAPVETSCLIFDMSGFSLANLDYEFISFMFDLFATKYPESLGVCLLLNAPWVFTPVWAVVRPWIDAKTSAKVLFVNTSQLLDYIEPHELLKEFGGTCEYEYKYIPSLEFSLME